MRTSLEQFCNDFIKNRDTIKSAFKWDNDQIIASCSISFLNKGILADADKMLQCKSVLKENTGVFSNFRGNVQLPMITQLSFGANEEDKMKKTLKMYEILKKEFSGSEYLVLASSIMADLLSEEEMVQISQKARVIYNRMKKDHPFLTSYEDTVFAVLMAVSEKSDELLMDEMEVCYQQLKEKFSKGNELQALSHMLAMVDGSAKENCDKLIALYDALTEADVKYGKYYELMALASLVMVSEEASVLVEDIKAVDTFLEKQSGYGFFGFDKKTRLMHAAMIVSCDYMKNITADIAVMAGTLATVAAQQAVMVAVIVASTASVAASGGN